MTDCVLGSHFYAGVTCVLVPCGKPHAPGLVDSLVGNPGGRQERDHRAHKKLKEEKKEENVPNMVTNHGDDTVHPLRTILVKMGFFSIWLFGPDHYPVYSLNQQTHRVVRACSFAFSAQRQ